MLIFRDFLGSSAFIRNAKNGKAANCAKNLRLAMSIVS